jgi:hypothetical protein
MNNLKKKKTLNLIVADPKLNDIKMKYPNRKATFWYQSVYNQSKENIAAIQEELQAKGLRQQIKIDLLQKIADAVEKPPPSVPVFDMTRGDTPRIPLSPVQTHDPIERMRGEEPKPLPEGQQEKALTDVPEDETEGELETELEPEEEIEEAKPSIKEEEEEEEEEEARPIKKRKEEKKIRTIKEFEEFNKKNSAIHQEIINELAEVAKFNVENYPTSYNLVDWKNQHLTNALPYFIDLIDGMKKETLKKQKDLADEGADNTETDNINNKLKVFSFLKKRYKELVKKVLKPPNTGAASSSM